MTDDEWKIFQALRQISHDTRCGEVEGVQFDLRHEDLKPGEWEINFIGNERIFPERRPGRPFIWYPWDGAFDAACLRNEIVERDSRCQFKMTSIEIDSYIEDCTPEIVLQTGDKIEIARVKTVELDNKFSHEHDKIERHAYLQVRRNINTIIPIETPLEFVGRTAMRRNRVTGHVEVIDKIVERLTTHFGLKNIYDDISLKFVQANYASLNDAEKAVKHAWSIFINNNDILKLRYDYSSDLPRTKYDKIRKQLKTIEDSILLGFHWAKAEGELNMKPLADIGTRVIARSRAGGAKSGESRRREAEEMWRPHALQLAKTARRKMPSLSTEKVASEIMENWSLQIKKREHSTLKLFVVEMEKSGRLPRKVRTTKSLTS